MKVLHGGWVPLAIALVLFLLMTTWREGRHTRSAILHRGSLPMDLFLEDVARRRPTRVPGTAVFMTSSPNGVPHALLHNLKHNKVLHERVLFVTVLNEDVPQVADGHPRLAVPGGAGYVYEFEVTNRAGTYWYHPHLGSPEQVGREYVYFAHTVDGVVDAGSLDEALRLVESGVVRPWVAEVMPLEEASRAHDRLELGPRRQVGAGDLVVRRPQLGLEGVQQLRCQ